MDIEKCREYCISKKGATEDFPFDQDVLVFRIGGKIFALTSLQGWESGKGSINLKCDAEWSAELRVNYNAITPAFHMNKTHWNTIKIDDGDVPLQLLKKLIDHSYELVFKGLTKKIKDSLESNI